MMRYSKMVAAEMKKCLSETSGINV